MIRPSTAVAGICLLGVTWAAPAALAATTTPPQLQLCADIAGDAPHATKVEVAASNDNTQLVEDFGGPGHNCATAVEVESGGYRISAVVLKVECPPLHPWDPVDCNVPRFSHFEIRRDGAGIARIAARDSDAYVTPGFARSTSVTAVFTTR